MNASSIRNVIFDFGGVLVRWQPEAIIAAFYADEALRARVRGAVFNHPDWIDIDRGTLSESAALERFAERMHRPLEEMHALLGAIKDSLTPIPESLALVDDLVRRGVPVYGLSNMGATIFALLKSRYDHWDRFRGIVISGEIGLVKPDPAIFHHIAERYALVPAETVFIDDHLSNIDSARQLGFHTIHFVDPAQCRRELERRLGRRAGEPRPESGCV